MTGFQIVLLKPQGFEFVEGFRETMEAMQWGLQQLGHAAPILINTIEPGLVPIVFGGHHLSPDLAARLPSNSILYNLEQLLPGYPWYQQHYLDVLKRFRVWDGDLQSTHWLRNAGIAPQAIHVPIASAPILDRIETAATQDIDVLFYGIQTERRINILTTLGNSGLRVAALNNVWAKERDSWIARSKVVMGLHQQAGGRLEVARLIYLLSNGVSVVTEVDDPRSVDRVFAGAFVPSTYEDMVTSCLVVARNEGLRMHLKEMGRRAAQSPAIDARSIMTNALAATGLL